MDTTPASNGNVDIPDDIAATLVNPAAYADHRIHDSYRWLRANNPLGVARPEKFDPFWVVTSTPISRPSAARTNCSTTPTARPR